MRRGTTWWVCLAIAGLIGAARGEIPESVFDDVTVGTIAVPAAAQQQEALKMVNELFRDETAAARTAAQKSELARKMITTAADLSSDPLGKYVLLNLARETARSAGDFLTGLKALNEMAGVFAIDYAAMKLDLLKGMEKTITTARDGATMAAGLSRWIDARLREDRYDVARQAAELAISAARRAGDAKVLLAAQLRPKSIEETEAAYRETARAIETLGKSPDDPAANLTAGRYYCLVKGDWQRGLPMLARSADPGLKAAAGREIAGAAGASAQVALADDWWELSDQSKGPVQTALRLHAARWYREALPSLDGLSKLRAQTRIASMESVPGAKPVDSGPATDLMPAVDPSHHVIAGQWDRVNGALTSAGSRGRFFFPSVTTGEYEWTVKFTRQDGTAGIVFMFPVGKTQVGLTISGWHAERSGLMAIDGKSNPSRDGKLENNKEYTAVIRVALKGENAEILVRLNGEDYIHWTGRQDQLSMSPNWRTPDERLFGIGCETSKITITASKVRMINGELKKYER